MRDLQLGQGAAQSNVGTGAYREAVLHIHGQLHIDAPVELVFDTAADSRNEPSFNPAMHDVALLTPPPVGLGSRFLARMGRARTEMRVELTEYDRPRLVGSRTTSTLMTTTGTLTFAPHDGGTLMTWNWLVTPSGWLRLLGPLLSPMGARMKRRIWFGLKRQLESDRPT